MLTGPIPPFRSFPEYAREIARCAALTARELGGWAYVPTSGSFPVSDASRFSVARAYEHLAGSLCASGWHEICSYGAAQGEWDGELVEFIRKGVSEWDWHSYERAGTAASALLPASTILHHPERALPMDYYFLSPSEFSRLGKSYQHEFGIISEFLEGRDFGFRYPKGKLEALTVRRDALREGLQRMMVAQDSLLFDGKERKRSPNHGFVKI